MCEDGGQEKRKGADGEEREAGGWGPPFHGVMLAGDVEGTQGNREGQWKGCEPSAGRGFHGV